MASGVNVKMGVSGVAQFKQNMNQAKQSVKTLDAQLALSEKQFKSTGDAESYMAEKVELLKAKMESQKNILSNAQKALDDMAKNGVDRASKAYQDMYRQMITAKGELLDTENTLNNVAGAGEDAANGVSEMNNQLKRIGDGVNFENVTSGIGKITDNLEKAAKKAVNLGKKFFDTMMGAGSYADDLKTRASQYGLTTDQLQRMDKTSKIIDTSVESILSAHKKLKKGIGSADSGVMGAFAELLGNGYDPKKAGWENAFWDAGAALMKFTDEEEKEVYAQKLFGRSWNELIPLFEAGREEYDAWNASWTTLSDEQINSLGDMNDEYVKLQENLETLKNTALSEFAEPMADLLGTINKNLDEFTEWTKSEEGQAMIDSVFGKIKETLEWLTDPTNIQSVIHGMEAVLAGWAGLKLTGTALDVLKIINGAKGLVVGAGGAGAAGAAGAAGGTAAAGGVATAATGLLSKIAPGITSFASTNGGPWLDWLTHESPLATVFNGMESIEEWVNRQIAEFNERKDTLGANWDPETGNVVAQLIGDMIEAWKKNGQNTADYWANIHNQQKEAQEWNLGEDATIEDSLAFVDRMTSVADDLTNDNATTRQSTGEMTQAVTGLKGLPLDIQRSILVGI